MAMEPPQHGAQTDAAAPGPPSAPAISLPKGGGAIRGIDEKSSVNPSTGTGSLAVQIPASPSRSGFGPQLALSYDSASGNGPFGVGWQLSLPTITRKTDRGLPRYEDGTSSDVFLLSGAEDLVPVLTKDGDAWVRDARDRVVDNVRYRVERFRPRIEGLFTRIERWTDQTTGVAHWRSIAKDNVTTVYGDSNESRIFDPSDDPERPLRIFSWLISRSHDDKGNVVVYRYVAENDLGVDVAQAHERNRTSATRSAQRYLKRITYGNRVSRLVDPSLSDPGWMFEIVFDYGEHDDNAPTPNDAGEWQCRHDPFSVCRPAFELRTYRRCRRILIFHHFPDEAAIGRDCLVRSTDLTYREVGGGDDAGAHPSLSLIASVTQCGYRRAANGDYIKRTLTPIDLSYSDVTIDETVREVDGASLENLPSGLDGSAYRWVDLDGEGIAGLLTEQGGAWFYKPNLGGGRFEPSRALATVPSPRALTGGRQQLIDLSGDGQLDVVSFARPLPGFFERTLDREWSPFVPFESLPTIDWNDPNLRFVDVDGDGHADVLIAEDEAFTWYPSLGEDGFDEGQRVRQPVDEERGARLVFADAAQSIHLADMSGDGLSDLVRIRNGEVSYWPNLGFGRFGPRVVMDASPWFAEPDQFDHRRIRLADIDGSGTADIIYVGHSGVTLYFNQAGNRWSVPHRLADFPRVENFSALMVVDLLGRGTACLVWSSPLPADTPRPMRYIDLMGGDKPHLLVSVRNGLGAERHLSYASSTKFYLADKAAGRPWHTTLPFPVHVVERVETVDRISGNRFVTRYAFHDGYFDGVEREFRGFGFVEQWDSEAIAALTVDGTLSFSSNVDPVSNVPPVLTRTWFHTGAFTGADVTSLPFASDYYRPHSIDADDDALAGQLLSDTVLPSGLTADDAREACRALKGSILRQEVYGLDGTERSAHPYSIAERNYTIEPLQPRAGNRHGVFFSHDRESIEYHCERNPSDPRVAHGLTTAVDAYGNILQAVAIGYGRRAPDPDPLLPEATRSAQQRHLVTFTDHRYTNVVDEDDAYRAPMSSETTTFELKGLPLGDAQTHPWFTADFETVRAAVASLADGRSDTAYEDDSAPDDRLSRRPIQRLRTLYRRDDFTGPLPLHGLESRGVPYENYKLALTPGLADGMFVQSGRLTAPQLAQARVEGGYTQEPDGTSWWVPSGLAFYAPQEGSPSDELAYATEHFFLPQRFVDQFGHTSTVTYDRYDLLVQESRDAAGNRVTAGERSPADALVRSGLDYRVLQPRVVMDANRNRSAVALDALGHVVATAVMGKPEETLGDSIEAVDPDLPDAIVAAHLADPFANPESVLQGATTRLLYDLFAYARSAFEPQPSPSLVCALARETHGSDVAPGERPTILQQLSYSDGFGRNIQKKVQAEPGPLVDGGPDVPHRWVGTGWTIFNNKGKAIREYEPFFSATPRYEHATIVGASPIVLYDPVGRTVATLFPNHTFEKVEFTPWRQVTWDVNDTVLVTDPSTDPIVGGFVALLPPVDYLPTWYSQRQDSSASADDRAAATQAARHAETPTIAYFDGLGRGIATVLQNRFVRNGATVEERYVTRTVLDIESNQRDIIDAKSRVIQHGEWDMLGRRLRHVSMDAGERRMLPDIAGVSIREWDSRGHRRRVELDALRRQVRVFVTGVDPQDAARDVLVERTDYGESPDVTLSPAERVARNLGGRVYQQCESGGRITNLAYDFKGNLLRSQRELPRGDAAVVDWSAPSLEAETFETVTWYDATNRPIQIAAPYRVGGARVSVLRLGYNESNLTERLDAWIGAPAVPTRVLDAAQADLSLLSNIDYNAKGQRTLIAYGNGVVTRREYDPLTHRLTRVFTARGGRFPSDCPTAASEPCGAQNFRYTYDPVGNVTHVHDGAQPIIYFRNQRVDADVDYIHDALYRLVEATGREHLGQGPGQPTVIGPVDVPRVSLPHPADGQAMGRYRQQYSYDEVGNILAIVHRGSDPMATGWTRSYTYNDASAIDPQAIGNRLTSSEAIAGLVERYLSDPHGNVTSMPHLSSMVWDEHDRLQAAARQAIAAPAVPETAKFVYDGGGQRLRKTVWSQAASPAQATRMSERIYLGIAERYREYNAAGSITREVETLHVADGEHAIAFVETRLDGAPSAPLVRHQLPNHLGSVALELDARAEVISYEEFYPHGSTSFQSVDQTVSIPKRYRHAGRERDEETQFYYCGARYYASWLGRWISADPAGLKDGPNVFAYAKNRPSCLIDPSGTQSTTPNRDDPTNYASFEEFQSGATASRSAGDLENAWASARQNLPANANQVRTASDEANAMTQRLARRALERDLEQLHNVQTPALSFILPSHVAPYLRDQSAGISNPYLRFQAQLNQQGGQAIARFTNRLGMAAIGFYGASLTALVGGIAAVEIAAPAVAAGYASFQAAYLEAGIWVGVNFPRLTAIGTALAAGAAGVSLPGGGAATNPAAVQAESQAVRSVWSLNPFLRGRVIERILGALRPGQFMRTGNFPTIDKYVPGAANVAEEITSIKSLDLGAASYQGGSAVLNRLMQYVTSLANYRGRTWGGEQVLAGPQTRRILELVIPPNAAPNLVNQVWQAVQRAQQQGITMRVSVMQ